MAHKFRGCVSNRLSLPIEGGEIERGDLGRSRGEGTWNRAERKEKFERFERFMLHGIVYGEYFSRRGLKYANFVERRYLINISIIVRSFRVY